MRVSQNELYLSRASWTNRWSSSLIERTVTTPYSWEFTLRTELNHLSLISLILILSCLSLFDSPACNQGLNYLTLIKILNSSSCELFLNSKQGNLLSLLFLLNLGFILLSRHLFVFHCLSSLVPGRLVGSLSHCLAPLCPSGLFHVLLNRFSQVPPRSYCCRLRLGNLCSWKSNLISPSRRFNC